MKHRMLHDGQIVAAVAYYGNPGRQRSVRGQTHGDPAGLIVSGKLL